MLIDDIQALRNRIENPNDPCAIICDFLLALYPVDTETEIELIREEDCRSYEDDEGIDT